MAESVVMTRRQRQDAVTRPIPHRTDAEILAGRAAQQDACPVGRESDTSERATVAIAVIKE